MLGEEMAGREGLLLRLRSLGGQTGWGEASPLPGFSVETLPEAEADLLRGVAAVRGEEWPDDPRALLDALAERMDAMDLLPSARFCLELALMNLATGEGVGLPFAITPQARETIRVNALIMDEADLPREIDRVLGEGYRAVKMKVGRRPVSQDAARVRQARTLLGPDIDLRLDANRSWDWASATAFAEGIRNVEIAYIEEPLADPTVLPAFAEKTGLPVALDETLSRLEPSALDGHGYARAVVLKPSLIGGLTRTIRMAAVASKVGMTPVLSAAFETGVGTLGVAALAASLANEAAAGLGTYLRLRHDVVSPPLGIQSQISVVELWGTPRTIRHEVLDWIAGGSL